MSRFVMNMQDKMECDWFKQSKHEVIHLRCFKIIELQYSQQNLNLKSTNPTKVATKIIVLSTFENKMREMQNGMH